jgi:hypothetical protein
MQTIREDDTGHFEQQIASKSEISGQTNGPSASIARALRDNHAVINGSSCVRIVSLKSGSQLVGSTQAMIGHEIFGQDAVCFAEASKGFAEHTANSPGRFDSVWQLWFSDGSGGPAKFGTCFYVQHILSGRYLAFPPDVVNDSDADIAELPFVRAVLVREPEKATVFFAVRGVGSVTTSTPDSK